MEGGCDNKGGGRVVWTVVVMVRVGVEEIRKLS